MRKLVVSGIVLLIPPVLLAAPIPQPLSLPASIDGEWVMLWAGVPHRLLLTSDGRYYSRKEGCLIWTGEYHWCPRTGTLTVREAMAGYAEVVWSEWKARLNGRLTGIAVGVGGSVGVELRRVGYVRRVRRQ